MRQTKKAPKWRGGYSDGQKLFFFGLICLLLVVFIAAFFLSGNDGAESQLPSQEDAADTSTAPVQDEDPQITQKEETKGGFFSNFLDIFKSGVKETEAVTFGIDVAKYQGTIDWARVADSGVDFVMVRVGYRGLNSGEIAADSNAKYNMQEAQKYGVKLGAYFFSTAVTEAEAVEEANWVADFIDQYPITYPVAYDCERFNESDSRQYGLTNTERTDIALAFLKTIEERGYEGMFYASRNDMQEESQWEMSRIDPEYKVWVAQYPENPYPDTPASSYSGTHQMWQYSRSGVVPGIDQPVDLNIAYFGYDGTADARDDEAPETVAPDAEALMSFREVSEAVTAKVETNLRDIPSQDADSQVLSKLKNGEIAKRVGISDSGWSKLEIDGKTYYAVSNYLTTDLNYVPDVTVAKEEGIETTFTSVNETVTAKEEVNLRTMPSVTHEDSKIAGTLKNGETARRVGISDNGWSKLEYEGKTYYAVSNYLTTDLSGTGETEDNEIDTVFTAVNESVTAKDVVNLRTMPSVEHENSLVVAQLKNGEVVTRTGINTDVGWSRVDYNGQTLYCVSSYLELVE